MVAKASKHTKIIGSGHGTGRFSVNRQGHWKVDSIRQRAWSEGMRGEVTYHHVIRHPNNTTEVVKIGYVWIES